MLTRLEEGDHVSGPDSAMADAGTLRQGISSKWQTSVHFPLILQHIVFLVFKLKTVSLAQKSEIERASVRSL